METKAQHGYLILADISGYTSFLAAVELEHAQDVLRELLELLVHQLTPTCTLVELEGDAVYVRAPELRIINGQTLIDLIEATYAAFKDRVEAIRWRTTCTCNACRLIPTLDLKFITHHGDYVLQSIAGVEKPVGSVVNLTHRLAKNRVKESTGWNAYALFTAPALVHMQVVPEGMHEEIETYEHLGEIKTHSIDLLSRYQTMLESRRVALERADADLVFAIDIAAPPAIVWDYLNDPFKRKEWEHITINAMWSGGRRGIGSQNHCMHGKNVTVQTIVDWRPFDYYTYESTGPMAKEKNMFRMTYRLAPTPTGTHLEMYGRQLIPTNRWLARLMCNVMFRMVDMASDYRRLKMLIEKEMAKQ